MRGEAKQRDKTSKNVGCLEGWCGIAEQGLAENYGRSDVNSDQLDHTPLDCALLYQLSLTGHFSAWIPPAHAQTRFRV